MPVYEYQCKVCHKEFEYQQRMSDPDKTVCEACGGELERLISRTAFALKGGGWYKDLYASPKPGESSAKGSGGSTTSSESKSEPAKTESSTSGSSTSGSGTGTSGSGSSSGSGSGSSTAGTSAA